MNRPASVLVIGVIFIAAGVVGIIYHAPEIKFQAPIGYDIILGFVVRMLAIIGGIFVLLRRNWARWLLIAWLAYHVALSALHALPEVLAHALFLVVVTVLLFRPKTSVYFKGPA